MNSWKILNEVIACIVKVVRRHIQYVLDDFKKFSVIADEVTDRHANKEILHFCVRYINLLQEKPTIQKTFFDAVHMQGRPTGAVIGNHILNILLKNILRYMTEQMQWLAKVKELWLLLTHFSPVSHFYTS